MPIFGGTEAEMELDLKANKLIEEIVAVIRSNLDKEKLVEKLDDYHANDIAQSLEYLTMGFGNSFLC